MPATAIPEKSPAGSGPLNSEHLRELARADERVKPIRKAARVAAFNGWSTAIIAGLSAPFAFGDVTTLLVTIVLSLVAWNEFRGRKRLNQFDPSAAMLLGWNQIGFLLLIVVYCGWMMFTGISGADTALDEFTSNPELGDLLGSKEQISGLYGMLVYAVYGSVIFLSVIFQGCTAWYYFSRRRIIEDYVNTTPEWIRAVQQGRR